MPAIRVEAGAIFAASHATVYEILADERGHPAILPPRYLRDLVIEKGGRGAGTIVRFTMQTLLCRLALTGALFVVSTAPAVAQRVPTFPKDDPTLMRIWRLGMDTSQVQRLAQVLFDSVGPRLTGSPGYEAAGDWALQMYRSWGIEARKEAYGTWRGWRRGASHIDLVAPRVRSLEGTMLAWSPGTRGKPVRAEAIVLPKFQDSTEFVKWLPAVKGKIVLVSPAWPTCRPSEDWLKWATPESKARIDTAVALMQREWAVMNGHADPQDRVPEAEAYHSRRRLGQRGTGLERLARVH